MKSILPIPVLLALLTAGAFAQNEISRTAEAVFVGPASKPLITYRLSPPPNSGLPLEAGGYFHPFTTPLGAIVTDFVPADHKHHRGVFLAWVEMHGAVDADFWGWGAHAPIKDRRIVNRAVEIKLSGSFIITNEWRAAETVLLVEKTSVTTRCGKEANVLDLTYWLTPLSETTLARWAFGGFCVRFPKPGEVTIYNPKGVVGLPDPSHEKPESDWPAARWYAATWKNADGAKVGVAIVDDVKNPPSLWHNHRGVRMLNPAITAPAEVILKANTEMVLRYQVVAFDGEVPVVLLDKLASATTSSETK
ncbi:MAG: DUF6807 family protein [Verrucomicrobiota bacterium]